MPAGGYVVDVLRYNDGINAFEVVGGMRGYKGSFPFSIMLNNMFGYFWTRVTSISEYNILETVFINSTARLGRDAGQYHSYNLTFIVMHITV